MNTIMILGDVLILLGIVVTTVTFSKAIYNLYKKQRNNKQNSTNAPSNVKAIPEPAPQEVDQPPGQPTRLRRPPSPEAPSPQVPDDIPEPGVWFYYDGEQWLRYQEDPEGGAQEVEVEADTVLAGEAKTQALQQSLEADVAIGSRARVLTALAPHLAGEAKTQALQQGLEAALAIENERARARALEAILAIWPENASTSSKEHPPKWIQSLEEKQTETVLKLENLSEQQNQLKEKLAKIEPKFENLLKQQTDILSNLAKLSKQPSSDELSKPLLFDINKLAKSEADTIKIVQTEVTTKTEMEVSKSSLFPSSASRGLESMGKGKKGNLVLTPTGLAEVEKTG